MTEHLKNRVMLANFMPNINLIAPIIFLLWVAMLQGCDRPEAAATELQYSLQPPSSQTVIYRFAVHPLHNPQKLSQAYQPLMQYLSEGLPHVQFELEASRDYQVFEQKIQQEAPAFILPNPWQTLQAMTHGYEVLAVAGQNEDFKGLIIVRKDSAIKKPLDLKGKTVSYPSQTALAAAIMPQYFLHKSGLDVMNDLNNIYVGSQESSIMNVYLGHATAGATWPPPWRSFQKSHPDQAAKLKVIWETPSLVNNSVMAHKSVPESIKEHVKQRLLALSEQSKGGAVILEGIETAGFVAGNDQSYNKVRDYIAQFEKEVRPVSAP
ncbi:phosphate/phosphite/phosphonate ABC transporter substrate-binding protein [Thiomicrorhabdus aquaedulcis]|uniref:phosphate/phosphite/phosphonate ABC transporter substrate-binding protein n=1 Tax=Thiomicrorhabdus aquaedulcis TaxID=2211106 RepID=UPI0018D55E53|nr:phosphate/phosphite/phosphonate ABC transporter substrate-binding protein [Thiomicrorhabdus aquaedulcis]